MLASPLSFGQQQRGCESTLGVERHHYRCSQHNQQQWLSLSSQRPCRVVPVRLRQRTLSGTGGGDLMSRLLPRWPSLPLTLSQSSATQKPLQELERGSCSLTWAALSGTQGPFALSYPHNYDHQHRAGTLLAGGSDINPGFSTPNTQRKDAWKLRTKSSLTEIKWVFSEFAQI